jgi:hypothetical protein
MDKNALEQLLSSYNWWMGISTVAVAVGILGEYVAHFVFEKEARRNRLEMGISILFGVLVLGGVVGEYVFGKRLSQASEQLQQIADAEVAQSNNDAAQARKDAEIVRRQSAETNERVVKAEQQASEENEHAAKALNAAEIARKNAEGFQLQIAEANERAAKAELETERLRQQLADRILTPTQQDALVARLAPFQGVVVDVLIVGDATEIQIISKSIIDSMGKAGWTVHEGFSQMGLSVRGILIGTRTGADATTAQASDALIAGLQMAGLSATSYPYEKLVFQAALGGYNGADAIRVFIGSKP